jgi:hypothetical protein
VKFLYVQSVWILLYGNYTKILQCTKIAILSAFLQLYETKKVILRFLPLYKTSSRKKGIGKVHRKLEMLNTRIFDYPVIRVLKFANFRPTFFFKLKFFNCLYLLYDPPLTIHDEFYLQQCRIT